jgi:hypothetical protein
MWLDGSLIAAQKLEPMPKTSFASNDISGCGGSRLDCEHNGDLARLRIYNSRLTDAELRTLYFTPVTGDKGLRAAYSWDFLEAAGPVVADTGALGAKAHGVVMGFAAWQSEIMKLRTLAATQGYTSFSSRGVFKLGEVEIGDAFAMELVFRHADIRQEFFPRIFVLEMSDNESPHLAFVRHPTRNGDLFFEVKTPKQDGMTGFNYAGLIQPRGPTDKEWHHVLVTKPADPSAHATLYMDGNIIAQRSLGAHIKGTYAFNAIGGRAGATSMYAGDIALARIYKTSLSDAEALQLFQTALHRATENNKFGVRLNPPAAWAKLAHSFEFDDASFENGIKDVVGSLKTTVVGNNDFIPRSGILPDCPASRRAVAWVSTTSARYAESVGDMMATVAGDAGDIQIPLFRDPKALGEFTMDLACLPTDIGKFLSLSLRNPTNDGWEVSSVLFELGDR